MEASMQKWEYKIILGLPGEVELNRLGGEGWELVGVILGANPMGHSSFMAYFKRPKS
jgi:hypothetical protein